MPAPRWYNFRSSCTDNRIFGQRYVYTFSFATADRTSPHTAYWFASQILLYPPVLCLRQLGQFLTGEYAECDIVEAGRVVEHWEGAWDAGPKQTYTDRLPPADCVVFRRNIDYTTGRKGGRLFWGPICREHVTSGTENLVNQANAKIVTVRSQLAQSAAPFGGPRFYPVVAHERLGVCDNVTSVEVFPYVAVRRSRRSTLIPP